MLKDKIAYLITTIITIVVYVDSKILQQQNVSRNSAQTNKSLKELNHNNKLLSPVWKRSYEVDNCTTDFNRMRGKLQINRMRGKLQNKYLIGENLSNKTKISSTDVSLFFKERNATPVEEHSPFCLADVFRKSNTLRKDRLKKSNNNGREEKSKTSLNSVKRIRPNKRKKKKRTSTSHLIMNQLKNIFVNQKIKIQIRVGYGTKYNEDSVPSNSEPEDIFDVADIMEKRFHSDDGSDGSPYGLLASWQYEIHRGNIKSNNSNKKRHKHKESRTSIKRKRRKKNKARMGSKLLKKGESKKNKIIKVKSPEQLAIELVNKVAQGAAQFENDPQNLEPDLCLKWKHVEKFLESDLVFPLLPSCPCMYPVDLIYKEYVYDPIKKMSYRWRTISNKSELVMHKGAHICMRSATLEYHNTLAAQVCCYDSRRKLITRGIAAGFPLRVSPDASPGLHNLFDYNPWRKCHGNFHRFHIYRKPNNDRKCKANPPMKQYKLMIQQAYDY